MTWLPTLSTVSIASWRNRSALPWLRGSPTNSCRGTVDSSRRIVTYLASSASSWSTRGRSTTAQPSRPRACAHGLEVRVVIGLEVEVLQLDRRAVPHPRHVVAAVDGTAPDD